MEYLLYNSMLLLCPECLTSPWRQVRLRGGGGGGVLAGGAGAGGGAGPGGGGLGAAGRLLDPLPHIPHPASGPRVSKLPWN